MPGNTVWLIVNNMMSCYMMIQGKVKLKEISPFFWLMCLKNKWRWKVSYWSLTVSLFFFLFCCVCLFTCSGCSPDSSSLATLLTAGLLYAICGSLSGMIKTDWERKLTTFTGSSFLDAKVLKCQASHESANSADHSHKSPCTSPDSQTPNFWLCQLPASHLCVFWQNSIIVLRQEQIPW